MTLLGYQQALCDMVASPALCVDVRKDPTSALSSYDISPKERGRLSAVAHQRGMSTNCTLHRLNRMTPIYSYLPLTCTLLGDDLIREAERFWQHCKLEDLQFKPETQRFASFLRGRIGEGALPNPYLEDVLSLELAAIELQWKVDPPVRVVRFCNDPEPLLTDLREGRRPTGEFKTSDRDYFIVLDGRGDEVRLAVICGDVPEEIITLSGAAALSPTAKT
jgi:hypothetical protein